ncbi:glycosyltransferase family 4 protein [Silvibacterium sp.]|uniref:glycosyltransferase family 4 protein n=1 Tax=Silvibacterium sp. TaxID=1964179 RepID=UPI0039E526CF
MATLQNIPGVRGYGGSLTAVNPMRRRRGAVVVHRGARDSYQLALALAEAGILERLVTDLYWDEESRLAKSCRKYLPSGLLSAARHRGVAGIRKERVSLCAGTGIASLLAEKIPGIPFSFLRKMIRISDEALGRTAGKLANRCNSALLSYSYYGYSAFQTYGRGGMLFQMHPHPTTMRRILREELERHPECAASLKQEWELSLPEEDYERLVQEVAMARHYLVASSFSRNSLIENGAPERSIRVIPYGVDLDRFQPDPVKYRSRSSKLKLLFVGRINQRKGLKYLLEALRLLNTRCVELTICGRVVDNLELFRPFTSQVRIRPSVSQSELVKAYQSADLFVFPSVGEGFGQVLLESLACGLPILSTTNTAAPDLICDGREGFIVDPRRPDLLAEKIDWAIRSRSQLTTMGEAARSCAERYTWQTFRSCVAEEVGKYLDQDAAYEQTEVPIV